MKNKLNNCMKKNLTTKLCLHFILFAVSIFTILWCVQVIFLQSYYSVMKKQEVISLVKEIKSKYKEQNMEDTLNDISYKNDISVFVINVKNNILMYKTNKPKMNEMRVINVNMLPINEILNEVLINGKKEISYTISLEQYKGSIYIYASKIENTDYCVVTAASIDPIDATVKVLKNQLIYVTIIALFLSGIISYMLSKKIAKPIIKINECAKKLAEGKYDIQFEKAGYEEIDNLANTLNYATEELRKTDDLRKELIANVSHDLKTPLTMIKAYSEAIQDLYNNDEKKRKDSLDIIIDETDRLSKLVSDMLDLSKLEQKQIILEQKEFDLGDATEKILDTFRIMEENSSFEFKCEKFGRLIINADQTKIEQVICNLLCNAINYSIDNKNINIKIEELKNVVKLSITDKGIGIAKEEIPYIWDRYYKANKQYARSQNGTGLGLSIVKNVLELHGAKYGVESEENNGSTFWFEISK